MTSLKVGDLSTAVLLYELNVAPSMPRCFMAERILVQLLYLDSGWAGRTASISRLSPLTLPIGTEVVGPIVSGYYVIDAKIQGGASTKVAAEIIGKGGAYAIMTCPRDDPSLLRSANPFCPNSKCVNVCSVTFSKLDLEFKKMMINLRAPAGFGPKLHWQCNLCGATMLIDRQSFDSLYKI